MDDSFELYDLLVEVIGDPATFACAHLPGPAIKVEGEDLIFVGPGKRFSMYALAAIIPFLPAKQRLTDPNDWMTTDAIFACPDPNCRAQFRVTRTTKRTFRHSETTRVPLPPVR